MFKKVAALAAATMAIAGVFLAGGGTALADRPEPRTYPAPERTADGPAALVRGYGWTFNPHPSQPIGTVYYPAAQQDNSSGYAGPVESEFLRVGTGTYRATLYNVNGEGVPHVTSFDPGTRCKINGWGPRAGWPDENVSVKCYGTSGVLTNAQFSVSFSNLRSTAYPNARLYYSGSSVPSAYSFNSKGGANTVSRGSTGVYRVQLGRLGSQAGHVQVTAAGGTANWCKVSSWGSSTVANQVVTVRCFTPAGAPVNSAFLLSYAQAGNILGAPNVQAGAGVRSAYASIDPAAAPAVNAARRYSSPAGTSWSVANLSNKVVEVTVPLTVRDSVAYGQLQVTALGSSTNHCVFWDTYGTKVAVRCFNTAGTAVFTPFAVSVFHRQLP